MFIELEDTKNLLNLMYVCDCTSEDNVVIYTMTNGSIIKEVLADSTKATNRVNEVKATQAGGGGGSQPTGTIDIVNNGIYNVSSYANANVDVPQLDTSDATATANDIRLNKTAYADGVKVIGTLDTSSTPPKVVDGMKLQGSSSLPNNLDTSEVTSMVDYFIGSSFNVIPLLDTSNVHNMAAMFFNCRYLTTIPLLDTSNVTRMASMFYGCQYLTTIPLLDTSNVTNMDSMFYSCQYLTTIPLLDTANVTNMSDMYTQCYSLSNESLNNILQMCVNATLYTETKTLRKLGLLSSQADKCQTLSNYQAFLDAGWTTGY